MVAQQGDIGTARHKGDSARMSLVVLPDAWHPFDDPEFQQGGRIEAGYLRDCNAAAAAGAAKEVHNFLRTHLSVQPVL
jgi:hypothetical protein